MQTLLYPASERGIKDTGWLLSKFFFSFSGYYNPVKSSFGSLLVFNDDVVEAGRGFGIHPHLNMEIISVILKGKMTHKDNMGYDAVVEEDWVQIMSGGTGLYHEEHSIGEDKTEFLQIWIAPKQQNIRPRYQSRYFPKNKRKNILKTIVSGEEGLDHCWINQNAVLSLGLFDAGQSVSYTFKPTNKCLFLFTISGSVSVNQQQVAERDALGIWDTDSVTINCLTASEFLVIETPINQK